MLFRILMILCLNTQCLFAQYCVQKNLSTQFDFGTSLQRIKNENRDFGDSCIITIRVIDKRTRQTVQTIRIISDFLFSTAFKDCDHARSYSTGANSKAEIMDNDYGNIIVADFNFDSKEDFAVINSSGGNGGPTYNFYIQNENRRFSKDKFLTQNMEFFPFEMSNKTKTLTTLVHANAYELSKSTFTYDHRTRRWKNTGHTIGSLLE
jgi:hypothetical protein